MKKAPTSWHLNHLLTFATENQTAIDGRWVPARPIGYATLKKRVGLAWQVFTGRADVVVWPSKQ